MAQENYYSILEVSQTATQAEIKKAYLRMCKKYHPDLNGGKGNEEYMKKINNAYDTLRDADKRQNYDAELALAQREKEYHNYSSYNTNYSNNTDYEDDDNDEYEDDDYEEDDEYEDIEPDDISEDIHKYKNNSQQTRKSVNIFEILENLGENGFFVSLKTIFRQNIFALLGATLVSFIIVSCIIIKRIFGLLTITTFTKTNYETKWGRWIARQIADNRLGRQVWWLCILSTLLFIKAAIFAFIAFVALCILFVVLVSLMGGKKRR